VVEISTIMVINNPMVMRADRVWMRKPINLPVAVSEKLTMIDIVERDV